MFTFPEAMLVLQICISLFFAFLIHECFFIQLNRCLRSVVLFAEFVILKHIGCILEEVGQEDHGREGDC